MRRWCGNSNLWDLGRLLCFPFRFNLFFLDSLFLSSLSVKTFLFKPRFFCSGALSLLPLFLQLSLSFELFLTIGFSHLHYRLRFQFLFFPLGESFISSARVAFRTIAIKNGQARPANRRNAFHRRYLRVMEGTDR